MHAGYYIKQDMGDIKLNIHVYPYLLQVMVMLKRLGVSLSDAAVMYSLLSTTLTGLINPIIYGIFSRSYRRGYTRIIVAISKLLFGCPITQEDVINGNILSLCVDQLY